MPDPAGRRPSAREIARYRAELDLALRAADIRVRKILGFAGGAVVGVVCGAVLVPLTLFHFINPVTALVIVLAMAVGGGLVGWRWARRAERVLGLDARWTVRGLDEQYERDLNAIRAGAAAMRAGGVDPDEISRWIYTKVNVIFDQFLDRVDAIVPAFKPPALPPGPSRPPILPSPPTTAPPTDPVPTATHPALPAPLIQAKQEGKLIPFVGAGLSQSTDVEGGFPGWLELPRRLLVECDRHLVWQDDRDRATAWARFRVPDPTKPSGDAPRPMPLREMLRQLDQLKDKLGADYGKALDAIFRPANAAPGAGHRATLALGASIVLTTNYDQLLEFVEGPPARGVHVGRDAANVLKDIRASRRVLFKVHGTVENPASVVLTLDEYRDARTDPAYRKLLDHLLVSHSFLFVGYGMDDPEDLDIILEDNAEQLATAGPLHFALIQQLTDDHAEATRAERLRRAYHVKVIPYRYHAEVVPFLEALARA